MGAVDLVVHHMPGTAAHQGDSYKALQPLMVTAFQEVAVTFKLQGPNQNASIARDLLKVLKGKPPVQSWEQIPDETRNCELITRVLTIMTAGEATRCIAMLPLAAMSLTLLKHKVTVDAMFATWPANADGSKNVLNKIEDFYLNEEQDFSGDRLTQEIHNKMLTLIDDYVTLVWSRDRRQDHAPKIAEMELTTEVVFQIIERKVLRFIPIRALLEDELFFVAEGPS